MKNKILILLMLIPAWIQACGGAHSDGFDIAVSAPECNNLMIKLYRETGSGLKAVDSMKVEMGKARLKGSVDRAELMYIFAESADDYLPIFVENSRISVDLNLGKPAKSVISGSESNKIFTDFLQSYSVYNNKLAESNRIAHNAAINNDSLMLADLDSAHKSINNEITSFQRAFVHKYINHPIACYILGAHLMYALDAKELEHIMDSIPEGNRNGLYYRMAEDRLRRNRALRDNPDMAEYERIHDELKHQPRQMNALIHKAATLLMGKPYVAGTLDKGAQESLVTSLSEFDCVTFQETCLALARDAMSANPGYESFRREVERVRYRDGKINGWASRLHYSTDWIMRNTERGTAADITPKEAGIRRQEPINFMSTHPQSYRAICEDPSLADSIRMREELISQHQPLYIPKALIDRHAAQIPTGSLVFITTSVPGLDYMHVGIALNEGGTLRLMHASSTLKRVTTTEESLQEFLMKVGRATGITVLRPL
ncbi:MAG: DUF1460 domain-containing protein [Bacteroidales bacterium]|nr:DUF1460 domain-containing protein [Bacteroidales bacterium]